MQVVRYLPSFSVVRALACLVSAILLVILIVQQVAQGNIDDLKTDLHSVHKAEITAIQTPQKARTTQMQEKKASSYENLLLPAVDPRSYWKRNKNGKYNTSVIIYTKQRCGSTFMSEPFNKHPDIFYIFEPLNQVHWDHLYVQGEADILIKDTFGCNSRHMEALAHDDHRKDWVQSHLHCQLDDQNPSVCDRTTRKANLTKIDIMCKKHPYKATKIITLPGLHLLEPYVNEGAKVILSVRDPRGVIPSRKGIEPQLFKTPRDYYNIAMVYCTEMLTDLHFLRSKWLETPKIMSESFHLVRYEDMAMDPVKETREIYKFLDIPIHQNVLTWAQGVAAGSNATFEHQYGTQRRNSTRTSQGWKYDNKVPLPFIHLIEDACRPLMKLLGYKFVHEIKSGSKSSEYGVDENINYVQNFDKNAFLKQ